jgi:hypothetical protein
VTCYTQPCKPYKVLCLLHYLPLGDESSPRGGWGICAPALPEVLTRGIQSNDESFNYNSSTVSSKGRGRRTSGGSGATDNEEGGNYNKYAADVG